MSFNNYVITHLDQPVAKGCLRVKVGGNEVVENLAPNRSIDLYNCNFSEATGIYAIYHDPNLKIDDTISINHYRRFFDVNTSHSGLGIDVAARYVLPQSIKGRYTTSDNRYVRNRLINAIRNIHYLSGAFTLEKHLNYCHNPTDVRVILPLFEDEFLNYLKESSSFFPYNMMRGRMRLLQPILKLYCEKLEQIISQLNFSSLCDPRSPAFVLERYMSFLLASSNVKLNECCIVTPD